MKYWIYGPATDGIDDTIKMAHILFKTNIPAFHHSIIPFLGQIQKPKYYQYYQKIKETPRRLIRQKPAVWYGQLLYLLNYGLFCNY